MNAYQTKLYNDLIALTQSNEAFYFKDFEHFGHQFRIFNYRLASYGDFCLPSALECRGHMFLIENDSPVRLASLPMGKFFNLYENPFTESPDLSKVVDIMAKEDGSLISSYYYQDEFAHTLFKSKGSLTSDQAFAAEEFLSRPENKQFFNEIEELTVNGDATVNMEWTSPNNRIVLGYEKDALVVLNVRDNETGEYISKKTLDALGYTTIVKNWVKSVPVNDIVEFVTEIPSMAGIEGYVVRLEDGQMIKIKTEWYLVRHKTKDSVNSPRRLFEAIISEAVDDIRSLFHNDPISIKIIDDMVTLVEPKYNHLIKTVEAFHATNWDMTRKDYAIKAQGLGDGLMGLYMNLYLGKDNDYKAFAIKNYKMFIGDISEDTKDE